MTLTLCILFLVSSVGWYSEARVVRRERAARRIAEDQARQAIEHLHSTVNSAMGGAPLVRWTHTQPKPASDKWYWRIRAGKADYLFTDEALLHARRRAALLLDNHKQNADAQPNTEAPVGNPAGSN